MFYSIGWWVLLYSQLVGWICIDCIVIVSGQNSDDLELVNVF